MEQIIGGGEEGGASLISDTTAENFTKDVFEASQEIPIIVDFWAPWCGPCKQLGPILEKAVTEAGGAVRLVKLNIDEAPEIAQQLRVQSIPAVFAFFGGRPVDGFVGAQQESQIKAFIDRLVKAAANAAGPSPLDEALEQAKTALESGDFSTAGGIYGQVMQQDPGNVKAMAGMARCYIATGQKDGARELLDSISEEDQSDPDVAAVRASLELAEEAQDAAGKIPELTARLEADPADHPARFDLALALFAQGENGQAIDQLLEIVERDRAWNDEAAKAQLVKIFEAIGSTHPDTVAGRQKLSSILFS